LSVRVFEHDRKPADPFYQRCHVGLAKFLSEHDQIALPVTELNTFSYGFRTVPDSQFLKKLASMVLPHAARPAVASMARQVLAELLSTPIFGVRISIDRFMAHTYRMAFQTHTSCNLLRRPPGVKTTPHGSHDFGINDQLAMDSTAFFTFVLRGQRMIAVQFGLIVETTRVALDLAVDRGGVSIQPICDLSHRCLSISPIGNLIPMAELSDPCPFSICD
jgi:hypothetical protein